MERSVDGRHLYQRIAILPCASDSKCSIAEDYEAYKQYYSPIRLPLHYAFTLWRLRLSLAIILILTMLLLLYNRTTPNTPMPSSHESTAETKKKPHNPMKTLGGVLSCEPSAMKPSATVPVDVNKVRPADIRIIGAMGDSIMVGAWSNNFEDDKSNLFPGNSFAIGGDESLSNHITLANILHEFNPDMAGASYGEGYDNTGFNVGVSGETSLDLPRQARNLIKRMRSSGVSLENDWKLITIFIGTNDIGKLRCIDRETTPRDVYKAKIEETISLLRSSMNRTIVSIVSIWNSQLIYDAATLMENGTRLQCGDDYISRRDALTEEYREVVYEIQNSKKFDYPDFTVVVQGFMDDIRDAFRNKLGNYDKSFYGADMFHLSKYGNAVLGKFLWNCLLEPVGKKSKKVNLGDDSTPLSCPTTSSPFIQTIGNGS
uniref:SGNH_hydro domain-containing protein n=1 Tax=Haemonchus contortus TaxID=6289 RepID=A0A7I5ECB2_HAECO